MTREKKGRIPMPEEEKTARAGRIKALRKARGISQDTAAERSGGRIKRPVWVKLESGDNAASTGIIREGIAAALNVPLHQLEPYLSEKISLDEILANKASSSGVVLGMGEYVAPSLTAIQTHYPNLAACLRFRGPNKWPAWAIAAAAAGLFRDVDPHEGEVSGEEWEKRLDSVVAVFRHMTIAGSPPREPTIPTSHKSKRS